MNNYIIDFIGNFGYIGMFLGMVLEAFIIIIPSELILATGGILAADKIFTFFGAFLIGLLGSVFCAGIIYAMGYFGGRKFKEKYGKYFFMKKEDIEKSDEWFKKYGMKAALIGRNFPIIRTFISLPIGIAKLSFKKFMLYTTIGSIPWTLLFVSAGYYLGGNWVVVAKVIDKSKIPICIVLAMLVIYYLYKKIVSKKITYIRLRDKNKE
ncbi:MAG: DedA family protein [Clostridia bacterium]